MGLYKLWNLGQELHYWGFWRKSYWVYKARTWRSRVSWVCAIKREFINTELITVDTADPDRQEPERLKSEYLIYYQLENDINGADAEYSSFIDAFYSQEKYWAANIEEYPGRKMTPLNVDITIQIQGINESKSSTLYFHSIDWRLVVWSYNDRT